MRLDRPLQTTLEAVAAIMLDARHRWWVIGSAAVALHGAEPLTVADVDILLSPQDARLLLPRIGIVPGAGADHPDFRSTLFATWRDAALPVEFMAGFSYRRYGEWMPVAPRTRMAMMVGKAMVFVPERAELREIIQGFGRPKDWERAGLLAG
ncbi:hypothetical protein [Sphingobium sp.]|uniref:hypothetical protein n=1 Tax=Sphingobium sp. TaxID=1912891 RepID=UPI00261A37D8|nr:hypothetical protein [Sphingobium sp.]